MQKQNLTSALLATVPETAVAALGSLCCLNKDVRAKIVAWKAAK
jgi:hypothetical protein